METERFDPSSEHAERLDEALGLIRGKLIDGAYDVLKNHHEDVLRISSGEHIVEHRLTRDEAAMIDRAAWSAGEDQNLDGLLSRIRRQMQAAGFELSGDHLDITVHLEEVPLDAA